MGQPRVLLLLTDLEIGGTPTVVRELAVRLAGAGMHVEVVGLSKPGPLRDQLFARGIKCTALGARGTWGLARVVRGLVRLMRQERITTVMSFLMHANTVAALSRAFHPHARYIQSIQTTQPRPRWHWAVQRLIAPAADLFVVPSQSVARVSRRWCGIPTTKVKVIPNAVNLAEFAELNHAPGPVTRLGFIGRLDPVKRIPDLLEAITMLAEPVYLHIFGDGAERVRIESAIHTLKLGDRVTLHGTIDRPQDALKQIDLLVLPSEAEGFGLVLIEAMAAGVPVVATRVPGIVNVVQDGTTGLLVAPRSPADLAAGIHRVIADDALRARLIEQGRSDVRQRFDWDRVVGSYLELVT